MVGQISKNESEARNEANGRKEEKEDEEGMEGAREEGLGFL